MSLGTNEYFLLRNFWQLIIYLVSTWFGATSFKINNMHLCITMPPIAAVGYLGCKSIALLDKITYQVDEILQS